MTVTQDAMACLRALSKATDPWVIGEIRALALETLLALPKNGADEYGHALAMALWGEQISRYADHLEQLLDNAFEFDPARYAGVRSWRQLHEVCDANEFLIEADEHRDTTDVPNPFAGEHVDDDELSKYGWFTSTAIWLVGGRRGWGWNS